MSDELRIAVDIGGTFTDVVGAIGDRVVTTKVPSTPSDLSLGVVEGIAAVTRRLGAEPSQIAVVVHATTAATNALLERRGARVGLVVTEGFRDILELGRHRRYDPYDLHTPKLAPLVPRNLVVEVAERLDADGNAVRELDEAAVREASVMLHAAGVEAIAVSFLHAYRNPVHERRAEALLRNGVPVFVSHDIVPEAREFERTSTTVIAAYLAPIIVEYLAALEQRLADIGAPRRFWVMKSSGGLFASDTARSHPEELVESGPAAGVIGATTAARELGELDIISFDMGGTTAKAALIRDGTPRLNYEYEVGGAAHAGGFLHKGTGYPLRVPVIDLAEVGTGGGSIAWIDEAGALCIGPRSSGAVPGPACYGRGGTEPTVTDADLVLGYLDAEASSQYLGRLDVDRAREAIDVHVAQPLDLTIEEAARGIFDLANAQMADAVRLVSVAKGFDPRDLVMIPFGGAGPIHAWAIARELGITRILIPPHPGVYSAVGLLGADVRVDLARGSRIRLSEFESEAQANIARIGAELERDARAMLERQGQSASDIRVAHAADMRYVGQSYEITVPIERLEHLREAFDTEHERVYGQASAGAPVEIITLRVMASVPGARLRFGGSGDSYAAEASTRPMQFDDRTLTVPVVARGTLDRTGVSGPTAVVQSDTTTIVPPGGRLRTAANGFLELTLEAVR
jgi:N-methylhydantoinase A